MNDRRRIEAAALVRDVAADDATPSSPAPATIVEIHGNELTLRVDPSVDVRSNRVIDVGVDGRWARGRVVWSRRGVRNTVVAHVELPTADEAEKLLAGVDPVEVLAS